MSSPASTPRRFFVGGNWKCNGTKASITDLISKLNKAEVPKNVDVVVAPTALHIDLVVRQLSNPSIEVSAQNCVDQKNGAFTGEVSAEMIADFGLKYVIIGHSERRQIFHTSDQMVAKQISLALGANLKVIACVGETLQEREANQTMSVIETQLKAITDVVTDWNNVIVAYEPVWAIGTGKTATPAQAQEVHAAIRDWLNANAKAGTGSITRIIYGGSVKGDNAAELASQTDIDGFLVGGASLKADEFITIINAGTRKAAKL